MSTSTATTVSYDDYLEAVIIGCVQYRNWRVGQVAYNMLADMRPEIAREVQGSRLDPFYAEHSRFGHEKIANFLAYVREEWAEPAGSNPDDATKEEADWYARQW